MKHIVLTTALAVAAATAWAQDKPAAREPEKPAPELSVSKAPAQKPAVAKKSRRDEDARHCLEKASNTEIIKCAEVYL
jgi:hypothetical protein